MEEIKDITPVLSVVIPVLNEAESLALLHQSLTQVLTSLGKPYEILFVDDGSNDGSYKALCRLSEEDSHVRLIKFRRNFGKAAALSAGFAHTRGAIIITMDGDLQDDPAEIPALLSKIAEGWDLVSGWKAHRKDPLSKRLPSKLFNWVTTKVTGLSLHDFNCGLKAYRHEVIKNLPLYGELHRYIPVMAHEQGFRVTEIKVRHHSRKFGKSKYRFERYLRGFFDLLTVVLLTRYIRRPLHLFGGVGLLCFAAGFVINLYMTYLWLISVPIGHRPLLILGVLLVVTGVQFISMGLIGELLIKERGDPHSHYNIEDTRGI
ncbi:MAG TPA: glycosyltransferase family 2 protein [Nitrospiria bacterium]|nr:glycosyltransferase family 2 protein [Nitrospiria bacterium]